MVDCDTDVEKVCFDFINRVHLTTDAELCILTNISDPTILSGLLQDENINSILDKKDLSKIAYHLEYSTARRKIKDHLTKESAIYSKIQKEMF